MTRLFLILLTVAATILTAAHAQEHHLESYRAFNAALQQGDAEAARRHAEEA